MNQSPTELPPIEKSVTVPLPQAKAFSLFVDRIGDWWPLESHSLSPSTLDCPARTCVIERKQGGRVYEIAENGKECDWGEILTWDPDNSFSFSWHVQIAVQNATEVEVKFQPLSESETEVQLIHRKWENLGENAAKTRESYQSSWDSVFVVPFAALAGT